MGRNDISESTCSKSTLSTTEWAPNVVKVATFRYACYMVNESESFKRHDGKVTTLRHGNNMVEG